MSAAPDREREYRALVERTRAHVVASVPAGARVLVVSRGDENLLRLPGRDGAHFPQSKTGLYSGFHPADGAEAAGHLADLRARGAEYLVIPATATWWLDHYPELRDNLEGNGRRVVDDSETCLIYALADTPAEAPAPSLDELDVQRTAPQAAAVIDALLPDGAGVVLVGSAAALVDVGGRPCWRLEAPGAERPVAEVLARAHAARSAGARYVVLLNPDTPSRQIDGRLRRRLEQSLRPVFAQRLVEAFEIGAEGGLVES